MFKLKPLIQPSNQRFRHISFAIKQIMAPNKIKKDPNTTRWAKIVQVWCRRSQILEKKLFCSDINFLLKYFSLSNKVPDYMLKLKKASRQEKRKLAKSAVKRASISTESKYDKEKREKLDAMIKGSKNRKRKAEQRAEERKNKIQTKAKKQKIQEEGEPSQGTPKPKKKKKKQKQSEGEGLAAQKPKKKKKKTSAS